MIGAHTDSPCLRVKPVSKRTASGYMQVGVETYGGGIWHSWFDRDLSVAGRVMVREGEGEEGNIVQKLVKVDKPILRIPHLAIHLNRESKFDPNKETELLPIAGLAEAELNNTAQPQQTSASSGGDYQPLKAMTERHHPAFLSLVAEKAGVQVSQIVDFELVLYDTQKACLGGLNDEFIFSPRLDNLNMTFCAVKGLIDSVSSPSSTLDSDTSIRLVACFDHEEIGSLSAHGADSNLLPAILRRLSVIPSSSSESDLSTSTAFEQTLSTSFLLSADMAHAIHPNYTQKYERNHGPAINAGPVIKINANQRYATNSPGIVLVQEVAKRAPPPALSSSNGNGNGNGSNDNKPGVPLQLFVVKNDSPCGSTIGPMLSAKLGVRTLDLGNPQLSMHSIRETGGSRDVEYAVRLFEGFLGRFGELEGRILVD